MRVVLESSHDQEEADDAEDDTKRGIAKSPGVDHRLPHLGAHCREIEPKAKLRGVRLREQVQSDSDDNKPNEDYRRHPKRLLEQEGCPVLRGGGRTLATAARPCD